MIFKKITNFDILGNFSPVYMILNEIQVLIYYTEF